MPGPSRPPPGFFSFSAPPASCPPPDPGFHSYPGWSWPGRSSPDRFPWCPRGVLPDLPSENPSRKIPPALPRSPPEPDPGSFCFSQNSAPQSDCRGCPPRGLHPWCPLLPAAGESPPSIPESSGYPHRRRPAPPGEGPLSNAPGEWRPVP